jgi:hypothetical protein
MKNFRTRRGVLIASLLLTILSACKKNNNITQADLIGKWVETSPCIYGANCFSLQFTSDNHLIESSPYIDTSIYQLGNGSITISDSAIWDATVNSTGKASYTINGNSNQITIYGFWHVIYNPGGIQPKDLHLQKVQ